MSRFKHLDDWLQWIESLHPVEIDLGLSRVYQVALNLKLIAPPSDISHSLSGKLSLSNGTVFTVAGTNGKGTCTCTITASLVAQGYRTGTYTSPHFHHYAERIAIDGQPVEDKTICAAFAAIDAARGDISLSYFEFGTLAALWVFVQQSVDFAVLEVGLGGRLDAVNIVDTDVAVITSIDMDHQQWLGDDRDSISKEKLGIARASRSLIIAESNLTPSLEQASLNFPSQVLNQDFFVRLTQPSVYQLEVGTKTIPLPSNGLHPNSVSAALIALAQKNLLPDEPTLQSILSGVSLVGRCESVQYKGIQLVYDVAHNPAAIKTLQQHLSDSKITGCTYAVIGIMADKDYRQVIDCLSGQIDHWFVGDLSDNPRALAAMTLAKTITSQGKPVVHCESINQAFDQAMSQACTHDRIAVFGSFYTVAAIKNHVIMRSS